MVISHSYVKLPEGTGCSGKKNCLQGVPLHSLSSNLDTEEIHPPQNRLRKIQDAWETLGSSEFSKKRGNMTCTIGYELVGSDV